MVRPETRARVEVAARELGYVPNRLARGLITGRSSTIVMVLPDVTSAIFALLARAAQAEARARGFDVLVADALWDDDREVALVDRAKSYAEGLIVCMPSVDHVVDADEREALEIDLERTRAGPAVEQDVRGLWDQNDIERTGLLQRCGRHGEKTHSAL